MLEMVSRIKATQARAARITPKRAPLRTGLTRRQTWLATARLNQVPPDGDWFVWLILAGRGFGKTRTGAETIAQWARETLRGRFALIAQTFADARDTMVEGESGLLSVLDESELRGGSVDTAWNRSLGELYLKNGSKFKCFSSEKARSLRGPQHHGAWGDEPATWNDADQGTGEDTTWTNLLFGLRLGKNPRVVLTGTPRPVRLIRELKKDERTALTSGRTSDNLGNLSETFKLNVISKYEGTRLGRQELDGELLDDTPGALWTYAMFTREGFRRKFEELPDLVRIVVAIDPQASQSSDSAETGIIVAGKGTDGHAYILGDLSGDFSPIEWAGVAVDAYRYHKADAIVPEKNNGGDMVETTIRTVDRNVNVKPVWASRGKHTRAEPISALYEQGKVHHVGVFADLEGQLTTWVPGDKVSPDRLDACFVAGTLITTNCGDVPIELIKPGDMVLTRQGFRRVSRAEMTNPNAEVMTVQTSSGTRLVGTANHPIWVEEKGFVSIDALVWDDILFPCQTTKSSLTESRSDVSPTRSARVVGSTSRPTPTARGLQALNSFTGRFGSTITALSRKVFRSTTLTVIRSTMPLKTSLPLSPKSTANCTPLLLEQNVRPILSESDRSLPLGTPEKKGGRFILALVNNLGRIAQRIREAVASVGLNSRPVFPQHAFALAHASIATLRRSEPITSRLNVKAAERSSAHVGQNPEERALVRVRGSFVSGRASVYNLEVEEVHEYFANGVLVHNCVWALTELMLDVELAEPSAGAVAAAFRGAARRRSA